MKANPYRMWVIEFWGDDDAYHSVKFHGNFEQVLAEAEEDEVEWQVNRINICCLTGSGKG